VQYVPDPATDERINFGVLAFGDAGELHARFVRNWRRIASFGGADTEFLKRFAREVEDVAAAQKNLLLDDGRHLDEKELREAAGTWKNTIQITPSRASTLDSAELANQIARRFLRERVPAAPRGRDRRAAAGTASRGLAAALKAEGSRKPEKYVHRHEVVNGALDDHEFDIALVNGEPQLGVLAMSFDHGNRGDLLREVRANAWTIDDVHSASDIPIAVVMIPPRRATKAYEHAFELFESLEAEVVDESDVSDWAQEVVRDLYPRLVSGR
jgi:hypothetical protein